MYACEAYHCQPQMVEMSQPCGRDKMLAFCISVNRGYIYTCTYLINHSYNTRHIIFTLHVNGLTFMAQCDIARVGIVPGTS